MLDAEARESIDVLMERLRAFIVRRVSSPADADDVLQEVLLRMQRGLPRLRAADRFGPWMYRIVRNAILDRHRARARETVLPNVELAESHEESKEGLAACIAPFVGRLASPYREAVTLVDLEGVTHSEAARMLGISLPGVKSRVQRGRAKLRAMFEECCALEIDARGRVIAFECRPGRSTTGGAGCK